MKHLKQFFTSIYYFFYFLTPKGKEAKMYLNAEANLQQHFLEEGAKDLEKQVEKNKLKNKCVTYAKKITKKKKLSNFHLGKITTEKHKEQLEENNVKIHPKTLAFKDA